MNIEIIGISHKSAPLEIRERLSFSKSILPDALRLLRRQTEIREGVILSTCNRGEIYAAGEDSLKIKNASIDFLSSFHRIEHSSFDSHLYSLSGISAVKHLFRVCSSLDSQVLGESQILGQIKNAYFKAKEAGIVSEVLSYVFKEAIKIGKRVRNETQIGIGAVSISAAAVELACKILEDLDNKKVLIIGAGKIGELSANCLSEKGVEIILVANKTYAKALELARRFKGKAIHFNELDEAFEDSDIVISSISAPHLLLTRERIKKLIKARKQRPVFFIDLGLPRNIDPTANEIDNVFVYNLDDLKKVTDENLKLRLAEAGKAEKIIDARLLIVEERLKELLTGPINTGIAEKVY